MTFAGGGIFNPAGEGGGPSIEAAAATAVLGAVVNLADWQYRRTKDQLEVIGGVITKIAAAAVDVAGNIWDALNAPPAPSEVNVRPSNAPNPTPGSKYVKARNQGGYYGIMATNANGFSRGDSLGSDSESMFVDLIFDPNQPNISNYGGWYGTVFRTYSATGINEKHYLFPGNISPTIPWGSDPLVKPQVEFVITHYLPGGSNAVVSDFDPFVGPVPGTRTPVRRRPIVTPIPTVQPATVPFPNPQRQPDREVAPPSPAPQPLRQPQRLPDQNPLISPVTPQPATTPTTTPAPFVPVVVPQVTPIRRTKTNPDGSRETAVLPGAITTPVGNEKIGPVTVTTNAPQATLAGIAGEVGRIEQKLAKMIRPPADGDLTDRLGLLMSLLKALYEEFLTGTDEGKYLLSSPCLRDGNGDRIVFEIPISETSNRFDAILERLDSLADLIQTHKDLPQPLCRGSQPTGQPVTVNFTQIE